MQQQSGRSVQYSQKNEIIEGKCFQIGTLCRPFFRTIKPIGNHTGQGGDESPKAADIYSVEQGARRIRKAGQKNCGGNVTDDLRKQDTQQKLSVLDKRAQEVSDDRNFFHISDKYEEADEGQQKKVIYPAKQTAVQKTDGNDNDGKHNGPWQNPHHTEKTD